MKWLVSPTDVRKASAVQLAAWAQWKLGAVFLLIAVLCIFLLPKLERTHDRLDSLQRKFQKSRAWLVRNQRIDREELPARLRERHKRETVALLKEVERLQPKIEVEAGEVERREFPVRLAKILIGLGLAVVLFLIGLWARRAYPFVPPPSGWGGPVYAAFGPVLAAVFALRSHQCAPR